MLSDWIKAIILGIVEGLTEFIPVSSTGHLILVQDWIQLNHGHTETFDITIQLGAILAVVVLYRRYFLDIVHPSQWLKRPMMNIAIAILPALLFGFVAYSAIKQYLFSVWTVVIGLAVGGVIMIIVDRFSSQRPAKTQTLEEIQPMQALCVGVAQCFSLWPGTSRSGSTIVGGLLSGMSYKCAAEFSFIISVPVMMAAVGYDLLKTAGMMSMSDIGLIAIGFVVSFVVALIAIKTFLKLLVQFHLAPFGAYRIILATIVILTKLL